MSNKRTIKKRKSGTKRLTKKRHVFDHISGILEDFVDDHPEVLSSLSKKIYAEILVDFEIHNQNLSRTDAAYSLREAFTRAEEQFKQIACQLSLDNWMSILRRFPAHPGGIGEWEFYLTLGVVKYSKTTDSTIAKISENDQHGIALVYTFDNLMNGFRLWHISGLMSNLADTHRWVGKGAKLRSLPEKPLNLEIPADVQSAVTAYEARRPKRTILQDEGFLIFGSDRASDRFVIGLSNPPGTGFISVPGRNISLRCHYFPYQVNADKFLGLLRAYEEAIEDLFNISIEAIIHFMTALGVRIAESLPSYNKFNNGMVILAKDDGSDEYDRKLGFLYGLCQKGYLRFPRTLLVERLSIVISPWASSQNESKQLIENFLDTFLCRPIRSEINLSILRPVPFVYMSDSEEVYVDFLATIDFIAWIINRAKEWFSSQHGDRFTLALKNLIGLKSPDSKLYPMYKVTNTTGEKCEIDLLVVHRNVAYAVECKAFAKSREFFRGDPDAVTQRMGRISKAVRQSQHAAEVFKTAIASGKSNLPIITEVEWIVCMPSQEYLRPLETYGLLNEGIPRVCTPEELISLLVV